ncbi:MAG TPA: pyridoxamine 5'-phosphate oxidase family protein [Methanofastidiosum sp.]|jgi:predicted pyridoxine 5'-phosphate oxidase superfamily flavin-nucleotide-binding protein|nr:pyridoxamine 5'-phosphate oxidase family protein [Methanofastidiosum sp.]
MEMPQNVIDMIQKQHLAFVATSTSNGVPNVSPKGSISVIDKTKLVFAEIASPHTISNLKSNPNVSLYVLDRENNKGVQIKGKATLMNSGPIFDNVSKALKEKMPFLPPANYAVLIDVAEIFPYKM